MQALTYLGPRRLEWQDVPEPGLTSDRAAIVRPRAIATCDLDDLIVKGQTPFEPPFPLGHECVAEIIELGDEVTSVAPGQLVSVPFQISCGDCPACRRGRTGNCWTVPFTSTYGFGPAAERWGGFLSELVCVPYAEHMLVPLPQGLEPTTAASASDNISDAWRAVGPPLTEEPGAAVLVLGGAGAGSIGLYAAGLAVALGADSVLYVDADADRRRIAGKLGAQTLPSAPERAGPFPITVDASGDPAALRLALQATAPDGICTSTAIYFGEQPRLPLLRMYTQCVTFRTGRAHARPTIPQVLKLMACGELDAQTVTTKVVPFAQAAEALLDSCWTKLVFER